MNKTFASFAFGCRVNQAEKEELDRQLLSAGFSYDNIKPSIFIINTCAVTTKAEREARQCINQTRKKYPNAKIVVTGCAATKWIDEEKKVASVYWMVENAKKEYIVTLINSKLKASRLSGIPQAAGQNLKPKLKTNNYGFINEADKIFEDRIWNFVPRIEKKGKLVNNKISISTNTHENLGILRARKFCLRVRNKYTNSKRLLLKIQDGCQRFCTYCIVPYLRGQSKSRSIKYLVSSIKEYEDKISEVILTAVNTQAYGLDTKESFVDLVKTIIGKTKVPRISFGSINPGSIDEEFIAFYKQYANNPRLIDFFHIPLQSASNKILRLMKRGYTKEEFAEKINALARINPLVFIGTDIIVGFLDETDSDFEDTYNFLKESPIPKFHIFRFSLREKTAAYFMAKRLKEPTFQTKTKRAKALAELSKQKYQLFLGKHLGLTFPALFLYKRKEDYQEALLDNQIPVLIVTSKHLAGEIKRVKITHMKEGRLFARILT